MVKRSTKVEKKGNGRTRKAVNLKDPKQTLRVRSDNYVELYCNHIEIVVSQHDLRLRVMGISPDEPLFGGKTVIEEKAAIVMTHDHAIRFNNILADLLERNFETIDIKKANPPVHKNGQ